MARVATIDATEVPELRRVAEELRDRQEPAVLRLNGQNVAIIAPVPPSESDMVGVLTREQFDTLMSAAGGWSGLVDTEQLKEELRQARGQSARTGES